MKRKLFAAAIAASALFGGSSFAQEASVKGSMFEASYGVGLRLGEGQLSVGGQETKFRVHGLSILSVGLAGGDFKGVVKNLNNPADFEGTYTFAEAGASYGLGANVQRWTNAKGVVLELTGVEVGVELRLGPGALGVYYAK